jgi:hypothetical protein
MSSRQDRQGARTPADLEYRYAFGKSFAEVMGIATDARNFAEEAKKVSAGVRETNNGIALKVKSLEEQVDGALALEIVEENGKKHSQLRSDVDKIKFKSNEISIESDDFTLTENGEITATKGLIGGWTIDVFGIHQTRGAKGTYTITSTTTGTDLTTKTYEGYLFYWLSDSGLLRCIFNQDRFYPYNPADPYRWDDDSLLWRGDMLGNDKITAVYDTVQPV